MRSGIPEIWLYSLMDKSFKQVTSSQSIIFDFAIPKMEWISNAEIIFGGYNKDRSGKTLIYMLSL
jgi:hypothetical protein